MKIGNSDRKPLVCYSKKKRVEKNFNFLKTLQTNVTVPIKALDCVFSVIFSLWGRNIIGINLQTFSDCCTKSAGIHLNLNEVYAIYDVPAIKTKRYIHVSLGLAIATGFWFYTNRNHFVTHRKMAFCAMKVTYIWILG